MANQIFIRIDDYNKALEIIELIGKKIEKAKETLEKISQLKEKEDSELMLWKGKLDDVEKRVNEINSRLKEPENF